MTYAEYIKTAEWRRRRVPILRRAGGLCEVCGLWPAVNVHHLTYERLGHELDTDLIAVCGKCHERLHGR